MYDTNQFRKGLKIEIDGEPFSIVEFQHVKPGKGNQFTRTKIKSFISGNVIDKTFRSGEKVGIPDFEEKDMEYLYNDGTDYTFMDQSTYDQISVPKETLKDDALFLSENLVIKLLVFNGKVIGSELPNFVVLEVAETDPGLKGDTAQGGSKPAIFESGASVQVPLFIEKGEKIKVDTRTRSYVERA